MITQRDAAAAIERLAPLLGKGFDERALGEMVRRIANMDVDIDLDAVVTAVILDGSRYEAALRNFRKRVEDAERAQRRKADPSPAAECRPQRPDAEVAAALREDAARFRKNPKLRRLADVAMRRAQSIEAGTCRQTPSDAAWRTMVGEAASESSES